MHTYLLDILGITPLWLVENPVTPFLFHPLYMNLINTVAMCWSHTNSCYDWLTGFEDIMFVGAAVTAMSRGTSEVDGPKTGKRK